MLKERTLEIPCKIMNQDVRLSLACYEDENTSFHSPSMLSSCDCSRQCGVKTESCLRWERCAFYGATFE
ncbi:hypothetical protein [Pelagicoccus sp. SDUM812003]|uniref:hypothetical protein n=1 Tax=Pelagicoccus sp. SDUM812003 TaxID=3041267 RepID=UPI00280E621E|nr:hypothetical protein [Pelagicoccus sp. SDUM812003]MDQ8204964.1 hypothetical protein [Pelagicoccus sp. SDUM812003]